jgi:hypothetical protein
VTWRDPEAGLKSRTFDDKQKAQELKDFLDSNGNSFKLAAKSEGPQGLHRADREVVEDHINLLRKSPARHRQQIAAAAGQPHRPQ